MSNLLTNFINGWALHMPGNPFVALVVLLLVGAGSLAGLMVSVRRIVRGEL